MAFVGLIGLGHMGHGIARNLLLRGHALTFLDHPGNRPATEILSLGGRPAATGQAVAAASDTVILCVTGSPQVEAVLTAPDGVIAGLRPGVAIVDCSTALPDSTCRMGALVAAAGGHYLDAPMTRTAREAHEGRLNLLVGGDAADLADLRDLLGCFAESVRHVGPLGSGHRLKLLHNFVSVGFLTLLSEAAAQAQDAGIAPRTLIDVLQAGGGAGVALDRITPFLAQGDRAVMAFSIANAAKDLDYHRQMSAASGAAHAVADGIALTLAQAVEAGAGGANLPELASLLRTGPTA
ncbi:MAG: NAD(P)-dependent oxidoreductase [Paracoccus sp.]|nr:NAD(P)-dependent oxidoreductase [Paracoccus sp. (in: a-proteobacteria)]